VVALRNENRWGGRKLERRLRDLGDPVVPTAGTMTRILHRHSLIVPEASLAARPWTRFEHEQSNDLWQMDFKGWIELVDGRRCSPLTVLDDHSRCRARRLRTDRRAGGCASRSVVTGCRCASMPTMARRGEVLPSQDNSPRWVSG
jgi:hypothetical protein